MPKIQHRQAIRLYDSVSHAAGSEAADALLNALPLSQSPTDKRKYEWACESCKTLCERFSAEQTLEIRKGCHCKPSPASVQKLKTIWTEVGGNAEAFAQKASASANAPYQICFDGEALVLIYPMCYCAFVKHCGKPLPKEWCDCSLGYAEDMFSQIESKPVRAELLESVMTGGSVCRIRITS